MELEEFMKMTQTLISETLDEMGYSDVKTEMFHSTITDVARLDVSFRKGHERYQNFSMDFKTAKNPVVFQRPKGA